MMQNRRTFMKSAALAAAAISAGPVVHAKSKGISEAPVAGEDGLFFDISIAEWSFYTILRGRNKRLDNLDFPAYCKDNFGITIVEYVDQFFPSADKAYCKRSHETYPGYRGEE